MVTRRGFLMGSGVAAAGIAGAGYYFVARPIMHPKPAVIGFTLTEGELTRARDFMKANPVIDSHAHPGRTFLKGAENLTTKIKLYRMLGGVFAEKTIADMAQGGVASAVFNGVADVQLLTLGETGLTAGRDFMAGEAWASYQRQVGNLKALVDTGAVSLCLTADDILAAHARGKPAAMLGMEGADFLETDISRLDQVYADGARMLTLVHYRDSSIGDMMTGGSTRGLTAFGVDVVARMNDLGMMIDIAHASEKMAFSVLEKSRQPVVLTHSHINSPALSHPRFISAELAAGVVETGGYIGAWPAGIGIASLAGFIDRIEELVETVGEDHVAMGSDMDANYKPVLDTYRNMPLVVGALMKRGYSDTRLTKILGGNFLRVMRVVQGV
ncbi:MAG: membrane dipeptidase [Rhodobacterales bacterium]|nr:membrane dipeptidase [Rhodobacterales bacterium]